MVLLEKSKGWWEFLRLRLHMQFVQGSFSCDAIVLYFKTLASCQETGQESIIVLKRGLICVVLDRASQQGKVSHVKYWWGNRCDPKCPAGCFPSDRCITQRGAVSTPTTGQTTDLSTGESQGGHPSHCLHFFQFASTSCQSVTRIYKLLPFRTQTEENTMKKLHYYFYH